MSDVRVSVECTFGKVSTEFAFLDFKKNLRLCLQPFAKYYVAGAGRLTNVHTCIYGSKTSTYFGLSAPSVEEYLVIKE